MNTQDHTQQPEQQQEPALVSSKAWEDTAREQLGAYGYGLAGYEIFHPSGKRSAVVVEFSGDRFRTLTDAGRVLWSGPDLGDFVIRYWYAEKRAAPASLFRLGQMVATPAALFLLTGLGVSPSALVDRHLSGDFGDLDAEDVQANTDAIANGSRVFSSYRVRSQKVWVITEADRSSTCVLLPSDY